jgi:hypothetical protein
MPTSRSRRPSPGDPGTSNRALAAAVLAALVVLAGCTAPIAPGTGQRTTGGEPTTEPATTEATAAASTTNATATPATAAPATAGAATTPESNATTTTAGPDGDSNESANGDADEGPAGVGETRAPIAVRGGSLPVNATVVYERVERLLGVNASAPAAVRVTNASAFYGNLTGTRTGSVTGHARFERALGLRQPVNASRLVGPNGVTLGYGTVAVYPGQSPARATVAPLLAHEFAHYLQFTTGSTRTLTGNLSAPRTTDGAFVRRAVIEGVAVAVETAYVERYLENATTGIARSRDALAALPRASALAHGQRTYVAGYTYLVDRYGSPAAVAANARDAYANPPQTSEQLRHGSTDPPVPLEVDVDAIDAADTGYRGGVADRLGEITLRVALANAPGVDAADAAAGWGEDALVVLHRNGTANYAWTLRFDTAADAAHAHRALAVLLDDRGDRLPADEAAKNPADATPDDPPGATAGPQPRWTLAAPANARASLHRPTNRTVVLAVGTPAFVADLAVTGANATVELALDGTNTTTRTAPSAPRPRSPGVATAGASASALPPHGDRRTTASATPRMATAGTSGRCQ